MFSETIIEKIEDPEPKKPQETKKFNKLMVGYNYLYKKYSQFEYSFSLACINNLIYSEKCLVVARFKDFLILDDNTEFLRRFYNKKEIKGRLIKILNFYDSYCKIFPNYMILAESKYLYKNIRRKQKMIDAFNEIKKEEEENRNDLKIGSGNGELKKNNIVFNESVQESINRYQPSVSTLLASTILFENNKNNNEESINDSKSTISISLNSITPFNKMGFNNKVLPTNPSHYHGLTLFQDNDFNNNNSINYESSLVGVIQLLNNKHEKTVRESKTKVANNKNPHSKNNLTQTLEQIKRSNTIYKKVISKNTNNLKEKNKNPSTQKSSTNKLGNKYYNQTKMNTLNNNKKFVLHKQTVSVPDASNLFNNNFSKTIKIINKINNIIINDKNNNKDMVININNNYFQLQKGNKSKAKNMKRVKSKEDQEDIKSKIFRQSRTNTNYNLQNSHTNNTSSKLFSLNSTSNKKNKISRFPNKKGMQVNNGDQTYTKNLFELKTINSPSSISNNKLKITKDKNFRKKPTIETDLLEKAKMSINRKMVHNYLITTEKKLSCSKAIYDNNITLSRTKQSPDVNITYTYSNNNTHTNSNINFNPNNVINNKTETLSLITPIHPKTNPLKFKLDKKIGAKKNKNISNSNKNTFLSSFNSNNKINSGFEDNQIKFVNLNKKESLYNKTLSNIDMISYSISKNKVQEKISQPNYEDNFKGIRQINNEKMSVKEMKEKYRKVLQESKIIHGSYDITNRLHIFNKFRTLNYMINSGKSNGNNSEISLGKKNKLKILSKKCLVSPGSKNSDNLKSYIKTPIKEKLNINKMQKDNTEEKNKISTMKKTVSGNGKLLGYFKK